MCPHENGGSMHAEESTPEMVAIPLANGKRGPVNGTQNGYTQNDQQRKNPYAPRASDFLSNVSNFCIIESTLRGPSITITHCTLIVSFMCLGPCRRRTICQCLLRHQDQNSDRQSPRCLRRRVHRTHIACSLGTISSGLYSHLQAQPQSQGPYPHQVSYGRRQDRCRNRYSKSFSSC